MNSEELGKLLNEYLDEFGESLIVNLMQEEDQKRVPEIVRECIEAGKPYQNYVEEPPEGCVY